jgi:hypothetical protein
MGHSEIGMVLDGYSHSWWDERGDAVSMAVAAVFAVPAAKPPANPKIAENRNAE